MLLFAISCCGCDFPLIPFTYTNYKLNEERTSYVGEELIKVTSGLRRSGFSVEETAFTYSLTYTGISAGTIGLVYREYSENGTGSFARPAFSQEYKYDLTKDSTIAFKRFRINILYANSMGIQFVVTQQPNSAATTAPAIQSTEDEIEYYPRPSRRK